MLYLQTDRYSYVASAKEGKVRAVSCFLDVKFCLYFVNERLWMNSAHKVRISDNVEDAGDEICEEIFLICCLS